MKKILMLAVMALVVGCTGKTPNLTNVTFPKKSNVKIDKKRIEEYTKKKLKDPDSALFEYPFDDLEKAYVGIFKKGALAYTYKANSKNSYGGYTGYSYWRAIYMTNLKTKEVMLLDVFPISNRRDVYDIRIIEEPTK